jgi:uncharacterized membrane protein YgcG
MLNTNNNTYTRVHLQMRAVFDVPESSMEQFQEVIDTEEWLELCKELPELVVKDGEYMNNRRGFAGGSSFGGGRGGRGRGGSSRGSFGRGSGGRGRGGSAFGTARGRGRGRGSY